MTLERQLVEILRFGNPKYVKYEYRSKNTNLNDKIKKGVCSEYKLLALNQI